MLVIGLDGLMSKKNLIVKSNHLVKASYGMTAAEHRLVSLAMVEARNQGFTKEPLPEGKTAPVIVISAATYAERFNLSLNTAYDQLKQSAELLEKRNVTFNSDDPDYPFEKESYTWVTYSGYKKNGGAIHIEFNHHIFRMFSAEMVKTYFTQHYLENIVGMTSFFAIRLYETLMMWRIAKKVPPMTVEELKKLMDIDEDKYRETYSLKQRVIDVAIKQINSHSDITASYTEIKSGRTIKSFVFSFKFKKESLLSNLELDKCVMTDAQRSLFSRKLLDIFPSKFGELCGVGKSASDCVLWIAEELKKGERLVEWWPLLESAGFSKKSLKKVEAIKASSAEKKTKEQEEEKQPDKWDIQKIMATARLMTEGAFGDEFIKRRADYFEGLERHEIFELMCINLESEETRKEFDEDIKAAESR